MVGPAELRGGTAAFLADARFAALTARDGARRAVDLTAAGGTRVLQASGPNTLRIGTTLPAADPPAFAAPPGRRRAWSSSISRPDAGYGSTAPSPHRTRPG